MMLDIKTLMLLYAITNVISAGAVAVIWSQNRGRFAGISFWLVDMILQAAGAVLIVLRGLVPDLLSIVLANTMIQGGALILLIGLERFTGKKGWQIQNYVLLTVTIAALTYFSRVQPDLTAREIALAVLTMIVTFQCCWLLLRRVAAGMHSFTRLTGIVFACYAVFSFAKIILYVIIPAQTSDFFKSGTVYGLIITGYIILGICLTVSLILMVNRRLLTDVKAQEEKFTTAFHSSPYAITLTKPSDGTIFEVNDGFVHITGYQYAEVIGKTTLGLNLWVREEDRLAVTKELAQGREIEGVEYEFRKKTGEALTGLFSASLVTINNETCILANTGDITARKQVEEHIKLHEVHLQDLLFLHRMAKASEKEILDFTLEASLRAAQSKFTFVGLMNADETVLTIHAWSKETMEQCAVTEKPIHFPLAQTSLLGESVRQRCPIIVNDYLSSDLPKMGVPLGHVPITRFLSVPVFSAGKIVAVGAVANKGTDYSDSDVSAFSALLNEMWNLLEQKLKDEALRESESINRGLVENLPEYIVVYGPAGKILYVNPATVKALGYDADKLVGTSVLSYVAPEGRDTAIAKMAARWEGGNPPAYEIDIVAQDGLQISVLAKGTPIQYHDSPAILLLLIDITERKELEERIRQVRSDLLFAVSHDLKSPLQALHQTQEMLNELTPGEGLARFREYSEIWRRNLQRLERMINNLLDSQRTEEGRFPLLLAPSNPAEMVKRVVEDSQGYALSSQVSFNLKLQPVPEGSCDEEALSRAVENLLTNAVKFSPKGGKVEVRLKLEGDTLLLEVEDHGDGIPAQEQAQLFQPFQRGSSAQQRKIPGTGLGLYVSRRIVEEHGGSITLASEEGKGTVVTVQLPWTVE